MKKIKCKKCDWTSNDITNKSGVLKKHNKQKHNTIFNELDFEIIEYTPKLSCPICNKEIKDIDNKAAGFSIHIKKHNISVLDFIKKYPIYKHLFNNSIKNETRIIDINTSIDNRIMCEICGEYMFKLTNTHLQKHNISPEDYKNTYNINNTSCKKTIDIQTEKSNNKEIKQKMINSLIKTNQRKYGVNSYTQTDEGKQKVKQTLFNSTYTNYLTSDKISDFVEMLFDITEYSGVKNKLYPFRCKKCNTIFNGSLENGKIPRCEICYPKMFGKSQMQDDLYDFIKNSLDIDNIIKNDRKILNGQELDIYLPDYKLAIEFNGLFWHSELNGNKDKYYHLNKTNKCEKNNIRLIHIFEDEWLFKKEIVQNRIKNILNKNNNKIYARNCILKEINTKTKNDFLNTYHIQGQDMSKIKIGAYNNNELIAVMTFGNYKYKKELDSTYELSRFVTINNTSVIGIFSKLLTYFIKKYTPKKIITFADKRWSNSNNVYIKNGFNFINLILPSYWYVDLKQNRYHRFNFRKKLLSKKLLKFDNKLTEWQNMQLNGYDRIWDCGNFKYELVI